MYITLKGQSRRRRHHGCPDVGEYHETPQLVHV
jgi:hypothetical protein